jgi:hypothetical protein
MNLLNKAKLVAAALCVFAQMATAEFAVSGGIEWELAGNTLTIRKGSGTGEMSNYTQSGTGRAPWIIAGMTGVTALDIQSGVTSIGVSAFRGCSGLTGALTIPEGVTSISDNAFYGCSGLTGSLTIPAGVTSIGPGAFQSCSGLTGALTIPSSVTSIGNGAFTSCSGLTGALTIPEGVTSIGNNAFYGCSGLTGALTIPSTVTSIGTQAFMNCNKLTSVINIRTTPQTINANVFNGVTLANLTLYVPAEGLEEYKGADIWIKFGTKIGLVSIPTATNTSFVYDASEKSIGIAANAAYTVSGYVKSTNAGTYTATVVLNDYCEWDDGTTDDLTIKWSISKATYDMSGITFADATVPDNGAEHSIKIGGTLPAGVTVSYIGNDRTKVGEYIVIATFAGDAANYNTIADMRATLTIAAAPDKADPIRDYKKSDGRVGIMLSKSVVSDKVEMTVKLENNERVAQTKVVIYDAVGNVVFEATTREDRLAWNLTNMAGRAVANGTYLVTAQVRGSSGKTWGYSVNLGVRR